jgi:hypothetical protein
MPVVKISNVVNIRKVENILSKCQFGFLRNHRTTDNVFFRFFWWFIFCPIVQSMSLENPVGSGS